MRRLIVLTVVVVAGALTIAIVRAQQDPAAMQIEKVKDGLYIITGGRGLGTQAGGVGGNTTVFITQSGAILIDTKYPGLGNAILDQVKSVTSQPITTIINTHTHGDHTGGNSEFPRPVEFVAHENTKVNMARMPEFTGENVAFLPNTTFKDKMSLLGGANKIDLYYFGAGHTDGDTVIVFPALRTIVMGDLFARKWAPLVDSNNGGSATAFPQTLAKVVGGIKDVDTVITGHSTTTIGSGPGVTFVRSNPVMKWADLQEYADFMRDFVAAADAARKAGKSVDEAVNGLKLPDRYKDYNMAQAKADVQKVYDESAKR
jgi:glyoxylase-like metal-dependent hydrolase (beta-lactamase superfamily II)